MNNKQQAKTNTSQKDQDKKFPQLQPLNLEQLDNVAGAPGMERRLGQLE